MNSFSSSSRALSADAIVRVFDGQFLRTHNTQLIGGAAEPFYEPGTAQTPARIYFREDYAASALHEVAHWCIAGSQRRRQPDYGYWYDADGRSAAAQALFMQVEARPQALEWCFAQASGIRFRLSLDNLNAPPDAQAREAFARRVREAARRTAAGGISGRAGQFFRALSEARRRDAASRSLSFALEDIL
jgi:elongation factor P hydroxylase